MPTPIDITDKHTPALCDSDTGESLKAEAVYDITDVCKPDGGRRALLLFTRAKRGRIVQITCPYLDEPYMGAHIHFFVDELDDQMRGHPRDDTFGMWADRFGLTKLKLAALIEELAPTQLTKD